MGKDLTMYMKPLFTQYSKKIECNKLKRNDFSETSCHFEYYYNNDYVLLKNHKI